MTLSRISISKNETERLNVLKRYEILDTEPEAGFDDIVKIASLVCNVPIALISLTDANRQWFKAKIGLSLHELPRENAFCAQAILEGDWLTVEDASKDPCFANHPLVVQEPKIRFYAGVPLISSSGHTLGTLCVLDRIPRKLDSSQEFTLKALARQVVDQIEKKSKLRALEEGNKKTRLVDARLAALIDHFDAGVLLEDMNRQIVFSNEYFCKLFALAVSPSQLVSRDSPRLLRALSTLFKSARDFLSRVEKYILEQQYTKRELLELHDGRILECDYIPIFSDKVFQGNVWIFRDLTRFKQTQDDLEEQKKNSEKASKLSSLEQIAAAIAHETDHALSTILLKTSSLHSRISNAVLVDRETLISDLAKIESYAHEAMQIAENVRNHGRDVSGQ